MMVEKIIDVINSIGVVLAVVGIIAFGLRGASVGFDRIFWGWVAVATLGAIMSNFSEEWME